MTLNLTLNTYCFKISLDSENSSRASKELSLESVCLFWKMEISCSKMYLIAPFTTYFLEEVNVLELATPGFQCLIRSNTYTDADVVYSDSKKSGYGILYPKQLKLIEINTMYTKKITNNAHDKE